MHGYQEKCSGLPSNEAPLCSTWHRQWRPVMHATQTGVGIVLVAEVPSTDESGIVSGQASESNCAKGTGDLYHLFRTGQVDFVYGVVLLPDDDKREHRSSAHRSIEFPSFAWLIKCFFCCRHEIYADRIWSQQDVMGGIGRNREHQ
jgi:hypothetical protein